MKVTLKRVLAKILSAIKSEKTRLYVQSGQKSAAGASNTSVNFPVAFDEIPYVVVTPQYDGSSLRTFIRECTIVSVSKTGFVFAEIGYHVTNHVYVDGTDKCNWVAVGVKSLGG